METNFVMRPCHWLKATLSCELLTTDFRDSANPASNTVTHVIYSPGGGLLTGRSDSQIYSISAVLTPHPRVYFNAGFSYEPSRTRTANSGARTVGPYRGDTYSANANGTYVLNQTPDLSIGW